jgi:hypothetical protein
MVVLLAAAFLGGCTASQLGDGVQSVPAPIKGSAAVFAFAPVNGVPTPILQALSTALNREAVAQRLNVVAANDASRVYLVRGFLSAVEDGQSTRLVYVWDVVDNAGTRLHRITGQQNGGRPSGDPWTGIGNTTIDLTARQTIAELASWVKS